MSTGRKRRVIEGNTVRKLQAQGKKDITGDRKNRHAYRVERVSENTVYDCDL